MSSNLVPAILVAVVLSQAGSACAQHIIAHRGASHDAPENTLAAFQLAWQRGADGVEGDFYLSSDGRIVCIHDRETKRVAAKNYVVAETNFEKLRSLEVGSWKDPRWHGEKIPSIEEVLATVPNEKKIFIELKVGPEIVKPLKKALAASNLQPEQIIIISFHEDTIAEFERLMPELRSHWLTGYKEQEDGSWNPTADQVAETIKHLKTDGLGSNANLQVFNKAFIGKLIVAGNNEFHVWTINEPDIARKYQQLGAWSITTDRPGWLRKQLAKPTP